MYRTLFRPFSRTPTEIELGEVPPPLTQHHNLPLQITPLLGREQAIAAASNVLRQSEVRLLTLTGAGGIGKTRLGIQVAAELLDAFGDGVCFVSLVSLTDPDLVFPTIAKALGLPEDSDRLPFERLQAYLHDKQVLLVLDNFEHLLKAAPRLPELLANCPDVKMLVTSRAVLNVRGEHRFPVPPLALPDLQQLPGIESLAACSAIALFLQRARAVNPTFQMTEGTAPFIAEICMCLDGLPLALELAAARTTLFPPQAMVVRLRRRLPFLTGGPRDADVRHQTLRQTISWSYDLLDAAEQRLFRQLAVFSGGWTLEAAEAVCRLPDDTRTTVLDGVASLLEKSLLLRTQPGGDEPRFTMLETIREYALERLATHGEQEATLRAHTVYYQAWAQSSTPAQVAGPQQAVWLKRFDQDHENVRAALGWLESHGEMEAALRLAEALWPFWWVRGHWSEGRSFLDQALSTGQVVAAAVRARALTAAGVLAFFQGVPAHAKERCEESLALFRTLDDKQGMATCLYRLGQIAWMTSHWEEARTRIEEAQALFSEAGFQQGIADSWLVLGYICMDRGEYSQAHTLVEESLQICRVLDNQEGVATALVTLARVCFLQSALEEAARLAQHCLTLSQEGGDRWATGHALVTLAYIAILHGEYAQAHALCEQTRLLFTALGDREGVALSLHGLGWVAWFEADYAGAHTHCEESLTIALELGHKEFMAFFPDGFAGTLAAEEQPSWAAQVLGAAEAFREAVGMPLPPVLHILHEPIVALVKASLSEEAFARAWSEGRSMTLDQVLVRPGSSVPSTSTLLQPTMASTSPAPFSASPPAGLTAREVDVLRLVAQGMTNEQVAHQLTISPRTVNTHLTSIFSKIGVSTRSAATRYAVDHHLV